MYNASTLRMINPSNDKLAFEVTLFDDVSRFSSVQHRDHYTVIMLLRGNARLKVDFTSFQVDANTFCFFVPYQPFQFTAEGEFIGLAMHFHPDFFCIYRHQREVACEGILFNNIYGPPFINVKNDLQFFLDLIEKMKTELQNPKLAQNELLLSYLKIFLIQSTRIKAEQNPDSEFASEKEPFILQSLKDAIEAHYRVKHSPAEYAELLNTTPKNLSRIVKRYLNKPLGDLIAERIMIEAKRDLYLTSKPVKTIAFELGFSDESYFSRFFKNNAAVSPQVFRQTVGYARAEA